MGAIDKALIRFLRFSAPIQIVGLLVIILLMTAATITSFSGGGEEKEGEVEKVKGIIRHLLIR